MNKFRDLPNELWLNIIGSVEDIDTLKNITLIKPELFQLFIHDFDDNHHKIEDLKFEHLYRYQLANPSRIQEGQYFVHEVMQRFMDMKMVLHNNQSVDFECWNPTINSRDFQNFYHSFDDPMKKRFKRPLFYSFNVYGELLRVLNAKSQAVDSLDFDNYGSFIWEYEFPDFFQFQNLTKLEIYNKTNLPYHKSDLLANLNDRVFPSLKILEVDGSYSFQPYPLSIDGCQLTKLESLRLRNVSLKSFENINLPNLIVLDLDLRSRYYEHHDDLLLSAEELLPMAEIPPYLKIDGYSELLKYVNEHFEIGLKFPKLKSFKMNIPLNNIQWMRDPIFLYFLDPVHGPIPYQSLLKLDLIINKSIISGDGGTVFDFIRQGIDDVLMNCFDHLEDIECFIFSSLTEFPNLGTPLIQKLSEMPNLDRLILNPLLITQKLDSLVKFNRASYIHLDYDLEYCEDFVRVISLQLKELVISFEPSIDIANHNDIDSYIDYIQSFDINCPNMKTLSLTFANKSKLITEENYNQNIKNDFIFDKQVSLKRTINLHHVTNLKLELNLYQFIKYIKNSRVFYMPNLQELTIKYFLNSVDELLLTFHKIERELLSVDQDELRLDLTHCSRSLKSLNISLSSLLFVSDPRPDYIKFETLLKDKLKSLIIGFDTSNSNDKADTDPLPFERIRYTFPTSSLLHAIKLPTILKRNNVLLMKTANPSFEGDNILSHDHTFDFVELEGDFEDNDEFDLGGLKLEPLVIEYY